MSQRTKPPFRADVVGSLLRPPALLAAREQHKKGEITAEILRKLEDDAIRDAVKLREDVGLQAATDGEFRRELWHMDFLKKFVNAEMYEAGIKIKFHSEQGDIDFTPPGIRVADKLSCPAGGIFVKDFEYLKSVANVTLKQTIPSPTNMHFRGGRKAIDARAYPDLDQFYVDLARLYREEIDGFAKAGCTYLQIDDVNFAYMCDPKFRADVRTNINEEPEQLTHTYAKLINASIASRPYHKKTRRKEPECWGTNDPHTRLGLWSTSTFLIVHQPEGVVTDSKRYEVSIFPIGYTGGNALFY